MASSGSWTVKCTDVAQFDALQAAAEQFRKDDKLHLRNLCSDTARCAGLTAVHTCSATVSSPSSSSLQQQSPVPQHPPQYGLQQLQTQQLRKIVLDYSRQRVNGETMELLFDLADAVGLQDRREAMRDGQAVNSTEDKPALHHIFRMPGPFGNSGIFRSTSGSSAGAGVRIPSNRHHNKLPSVETALLQVFEARQKVMDFSNAVRNADYRGVTGAALTNVVVVGVGGHFFGPQCVFGALEAEQTAAQAATGRTLRFLSNVDPVTFQRCTYGLNPETTLVILSSQNLDEAETILNARTIKNWLVANLATSENGTTAASEKLHSKSGITPAQVVSKHIVAICNNVTRCVHFGVARSNVFYLWDWVNARFGVTSAITLLPLSIHYSYPVMKSFLDGAHDMDEHFFNAPLRDNIPVILGLLGVWNSTFLGYSCRAMVPYAHALRRFPAWQQKVDMESNGKRVALDGTPLHHNSGQILLGGDAGTTVQYSFFQFLYQGRVIPCDFIGFMESQRPIDLRDDAVSSHDELMTNFFAQPDALAYGKTLVDLVQEGAPEPLREHMVLTGNRPSSSLLFTKLDAFAVGQLLALYEHRAAVVGFVWGINSFDSFGTEYGKMLGNTVRAQLSASRKTGASVQGFNSSTSWLLDHYLAQEKSRANRIGPDKR